MSIMEDPVPNLGCRKFQYVRFGTLFVFLLTGLIIASVSSIYASTDPYASGYDHGCNDARILNPSDRYINQPEQGPSFHAVTFMQGYYDGFGACTNSIESMVGPEAETFKIDTTIDFDPQAILDANGNNLGDAWFTINGQRYDKGTSYDMIDWVYDDDVEILGININSLYKVIELPYPLEAGQDIQVCLNDDKGYQVCKIIANSEENRPAKINFTYP
jgi:hypothetical protein